jgi:hypothetical protein
MWSCVCIRRLFRWKRTRGSHSLCSGGSASGAARSASGGGGANGRVSAIACGSSLPNWMPRLPSGLGVVGAAKRKKPAAQSRHRPGRLRAGCCGSPRWRRRRGRPPTCSMFIGLAGKSSWCLKKMKPLLRLNQIRSKHATSAAATVRTLLIAWALPEGTTTLLRTLLSATALPEMAVVSSGLLSGLGLDTLRQQVQGRWSEARLQACLPRLRRFLCSRPRRRGHQETTVRAWLEHRARARPDKPCKVA